MICVLRWLTICFAVLLFSMRGDAGIFCMCQVAGPPALPVGVTLSAIDGETMTSSTTMSHNYYTRNGFSEAATLNWDSTSFYPLGPWDCFMTVSGDATRWAALNWNTCYVAFPSTDPVQSLFQNNNISVILNENIGLPWTPGAETVGLETYDEPSTSAEFYNGMSSQSNAVQDSRFWWVNNTYSWITQGYPSSNQQAAWLAALQTTPNSTTRHINWGTIDFYPFSGMGIANDAPNKTATIYNTGLGATATSSCNTSCTTLNFSGGVPSGVTVGMFVWDNNSQTVFTSGQIVVSKTSTSVTISAAPNATVNSGDLIGFTVSADMGRRAFIYGDIIDTERTYQAGNYPAPILSIIEDGGPYADSNNTVASYIQPEELNWAVWDSIIHGARGIIYFNGSFAGPAQSSDNMADSWYQSAQTTASFTASGSGTTLTVTGIGTQQQIFPNNVLGGNACVPSGTTIVSAPAGGGNGSYTTSKSTTCSAASLSTTQSTSMYAQMQATDSEVLAQAAIVNSPNANGYATVSPASTELTPPLPPSSSGAGLAAFTGGIDMLVKYYNNQFYIIATTRSGESSTGISATFTLADSGATSASVVYDSDGNSASIPISGGQFSATFNNAWSVKIWRING